MAEHPTPSKIVVDVFRNDENNTRTEHSIRLPSMEDWQLNLIALNKKIGKTFQTYHGYALKINDTVIGCDDFQALKTIIDECHRGHTDLPNIEIVDDHLLPMDVAPPLSAQRYRAITVHHKHARHTFGVPIDIHESDDHIYTTLLADIGRKFQMKRDSLKLYEMYEEKKLDITDWDDLYESLQEKKVDQVLHLYVNTLIMIASDISEFKEMDPCAVSAVCSAPIFENVVLESSQEDPRSTECKDRHAKVVLLGDSGVGKSSIEQRFVWNRFSDWKEPTVGAMFSRRTLDYGTFRFTFEIWDTAGQDRFRSLTPLYYRNATAALIVYDITCYQSFESAIQWIHELYQYDDQIVVALCGNKLDLYSERKVLYGKAKDVTMKYNLALFAETSAKTNVNITKMFKKLGGIIAKTTTPRSRNYGFHVHNHQQQRDIADEAGWCGGYCSNQ